MLTLFTIPKPFVEEFRETPAAERTLLVPEFLRFFQFPDLWETCFSPRGRHA